MSAAAARRRKQQKQRAAANSGGENDPVQLRLDALLQDPTLAEEAVAYEALQLAQSCVRRNVKLGQFSKAADVAYTSSLALLVKSGRASVSSQLLAVLVQVLSETHTQCTDEWVGRFTELDAAYRTAIDKDESMSSEERGRLQRLHLQFLKKGLKWSNDLGTVRFGAMGMHTLLGDHCWDMSCDETVVGTEAERKEAAAEAATSQDDEDGEFEEDDLEIGLRNEAVSHYALAEKVDVILEKLKTLPAPTAEEQTMGHVCPPAQRDALLTRSVLVLLAIENLRNARTLVSSYLEEIENPTRSSAELTKSYLDKKDGKAPSHIIFACMLIRICEKDTKTAPLFTWLVRNFGAELGTVHDPEVIKTYTTKIGRVYFDIQPPPSMMSTMENMMSMMGGGGMGGMGGGGGAPGGMNPAAMMQAMQAMQGGGI
mmetsp:Transcript_14092/g.30636  ORF Transcript_14092/g.30636 Transcript_14092/m.30636 type:complete len:427 (-) Transcript_14092:150-1430(-)|eukprot:CAMPEP_0172299050 /NCGR_PEP_ID=MMETSP1058-20130122/1430_1 /TAXON_ID=83371 /ORGANISM="Detonula confervacea, Strain CCMP 353" /LENGTH=426 /DNA_ID=CAMNT_0013008359 /DNA_START=14 /DNA_END=1294 /DNA_ORIENTATION=+